MTFLLLCARRWATAASCALFISSCATNQVAAPAVTASDLPKVLLQSKKNAYLRSVQTGSDTFSLQTGSRLFRKSGSPDIDLVGAMHAADRDYYKQLTKELFLADVVLFEGVVDESQGGRTVTSQEKSQASQNSGYGRMSRSLGISLQHDSIPYQDKRFRRSDMTIQQMQQILAKENSQAAEQQFTKVRKTLHGKSWLANAGISLIGANQGLRERARLMMVSELSKDSDKQSLNPRLERLILEDRNAHVMKDLKNLTTKEPGHRRIALFYGAGHLPDMSQRLQAMGYRPAAPVRWSSAITIHPYSVGIDAREVNKAFSSN